MKQKIETLILDYAVHQLNERILPSMEGDGFNPEVKSIKIDKGIGKVSIELNENDIVEASTYLIERIEEHTIFKRIQFIFSACKDDEGIIIRVEYSFSPDEVLKDILNSYSAK